MAVPQRPPVVIDNGTGYTKMGYAGNFEPNYLIPTIIATSGEKHKSNAGTSTGGASSSLSTTSNKDETVMSDLDFFIGNEALVTRHNYDIDYPIRHGIIDNWDNMERYWSRCIYQYLCCDPEEHYFLLTEPPLNTPENREYTAEIMFETFNVPGLYIAVQAVLALCASLLTKDSANKPGSNPSITGTVIDSGDGVTHIIPVFEGYVIGSCIKHIPLAGRDVTNFVVQMLRDRGEQFPPDMALELAKQIKEQFCYVCPDLVKEFSKYDTDPTKFKKLGGTDVRAGKPYSIDVGYERFLGPELFFSPEIFSSDYTDPLPNVVDSMIQSCPIDTRRALYRYISLSGGSTLFRHFPRRLERDIRALVKQRHDLTVAKYRDIETREVNVNVISHSFQRFAVWFGGSMLASQPQFLNYFHTKAQYEEQGPRIARHNPVFNSIT